MLLFSSKLDVTKPCHNYQFPAVQQMLYSCKLIWDTAKFHIYTLLKMLEYIMKSQIKLSYSQETKGSYKPHGAASWLVLWTGVCLKPLSL